MRRLMLLRHAKSDWPEGVDDHERPLAKRGKQASPLMGIYMAEEGLLPDLVITSTARRARETWELVRAAFARDIAQNREPRFYDAPALNIMDIIKKTRPDVHVLLLVGHNPGFHELALRFIGEARQSDLLRLQQKYPTAGLVVIDFDVESWTDIGEDLGQLQRFVTPKSLQDG